MVMLQRGLSRLRSIRAGVKPGGRTLYGVMNVLSRNTRHHTHSEYFETSTKNWLKDCIASYHKFPDAKLIV
jgi:hypothetical protein